ncbi:DUF4238 domain-containing protein [Poseidonibacter lekithochrous]|uniref:DUF4238 domain-containing protein n=1 Tax=Poseidonibacter lekithochrous TaxID=1904463 RepID=UPI000D3CEB93|nr:DUF4238 domain-containing protein [Poseidonibacter lekithochrous]
MSGNRHHFIPRFLMRGFATLRKKDIYQTWVYRKDKIIFPTNTNNVNIETNFYGVENDSEVDNKITALEPTFLKYFDEIKDYTFSSVIDKIFCVDFITHLSIRTKYVRNTMEDATNKIFTYLEEEFVTEESFENYLIDNVRKNIFLIKDEIRQGILINNPSVNIFEINLIIDNVISNLINYHISGTIQYKTPNFFADILRESMRKDQKNYLRAITQVKSTAVSLSKETHNNGLNKIIEKKASEYSENMLMELNWLLYYDETANYILGDVGPIVSDINGNYGSIVNFEKDYVQVFLPITSKHLIVGYIDDCLNIPNSEVLSSYIAKTSHDYFISELKSDFNLQLVNEIGTNVFSINVRKDLEE